MELELFLISFIVFLWLTSAWAAFNQLSGGMVRRCESKNRDLARKLQKMLDGRKEYLIAFRILVLFSLAVVAVEAYSFIDERYSGIPPIKKILMSSGVMICFVILSETVSRLMLFKMDIAILRVTVPVVRFFTYSVLFPLIFTFRTIQGKLEDIQQKNEKYNEKTSAEDEIMSLVENDNGGRKDESLEEDERRMIRGIFDLDDTLVREIMTPRVDIKGLSLSESIEEARKRFIESGHSRIPVYEENVDQIKGLVFAKDFLDIEAQKNKKLIDLMHVPVFIPETKAVSDLLDELKKTGNHMAVIIDEYGGTAGIVTLEDIIEEIVGEIQDEYDTVEDQPREPETLSDGSIVFEARTQICDVNELLETDIPEGEEVDTIGGYVCSELGRIPLSGEKTVIEKNISVTVLKADNRKITLLKLKKEEEDVKRNKE